MAGGGGCRMGVANLVEDQPDDHAARIAAFALQARAHARTRTHARARTHAQHARASRMPAAAPPPPLVAAPRTPIERGRLGACALRLGV